MFEWAKYFVKKDYDYVMKLLEENKKVEAQKYILNKINDFKIKENILICPLFIDIEGDEIIIREDRQLSCKESIIDER